MSKEMRIIKRDGREERFDIDKVRRAIQGANQDLNAKGLHKETLRDEGVEYVVAVIEGWAEDLGHTPHVEEVQNEVHNLLAEVGRYELARQYEAYRTEHAIERDTAVLFARAEAIVDCVSEEARQENSNKNVDVVSVQRDYIAGEVSRAYTEQKLLPDDILTAHREGVIHFHDTDYFMTREHNCFSGDTQIVTSDGVFRFDELNDGQKVNIIDETGLWQQATVHTYGEQQMYRITMHAGRSRAEVICTKDHAWILKDGTRTTNLSVGDTLIALPSLQIDNEVRTEDDAKHFAYGFAIGDGCDHKNHDTMVTQIRLCGKKRNYADIMRKAGASVTYPQALNGDAMAYMRPAFKQDIINGHAWRHMTLRQRQMLFLGYYAADGHKHDNRLATADERLAQLIRENSALAGYYISAEEEIIRDTPYKKKAHLFEFRFRKKQNPRNQWIIDEIEQLETETAWCVEEPVTHTFTLANGIVTGNCGVYNLEDMLQNGTVISGTMIEKPHSFSTACNIATQVIAQIASTSYGGQTFTLAHLAPFVDVSRKKFAKRLADQLYEANDTLDKETFDSIVESQVRDEVKKGIQTIQYQLITLMTTNGQAPFVSVFMWLDEVPEGQVREDLAMMIEETIRQRYQGVKDKTGNWITPAFPKLLYVLDEDNAYEGSRYFYLTKLAAQCTARRLVPDYVSAKKMRELKLSKGETPGHGDIYGPMGCTDGDEVIAWRLDGALRVESIRRMYDEVAKRFGAKAQEPGSPHTLVDLDGVEIFDDVNGWTACRRIIRNRDQRVLSLKFANGRTLTCTPDHPFTTENRGDVRADELTDADVIRIDKTSSYDEGTAPYDPEIAWLKGLLLCDGCYDKHLNISVAESGEDDIADRFSSVMRDKFGLETHVVEQHRERKGDYKDVYVNSDGTNRLVRLMNDLIAEFGGIRKYDRHVPADAFSWNREARIALLAGMIDADGYVNDHMRMSSVQIGSTNKELALQQMMLAQSLGMRASVYQNHYKGKGRGDTVRYHVTFHPTQELIDALACEKKRSKFKPAEHKNDSISVRDVTSLTSVTELDGVMDVYDVTTDSEHFMVSGIHSHNCRSFLTPDRSGNGFDNVARAKNWQPGKPKYYGRFNQGVVTINLPDVALSSGGDMDKFWEIFEERLELCHRALRLRHERLKGTLSDAAPILWQHGALARLDPGEKIDPLLYGGYSTISLGYAGLYECVKYMTGVSHTDHENGGHDFAIAVMQKMNDKCAEWKAAEDIDYSIYGTPIESTTYKFAKSLQRRFGIIPDVTDHGYITNSYHVNVREDIDAFTKLTFESEFQHLSPGGAISYVEVPDMQDNIDAVIAIMQHIYENIIYAELNTKSDLCEECGYDGEIKVIEEGGKLIWECPNCGNRDQNKMHVARRTCGYVGSEFWNQGRTEEIRDRVLHA